MRTKVVAGNWKMNNDKKESKQLIKGLKKAIKKELVFIDGILATTSKFISGGEKIELFQSEESTNFNRLKLDLKVLFEDDYLAIIFKPAGILVSGNKFVTITNALAQNLQKSNQPDAVKPQPIHRLDYPTSGLLLVGKTSSAIIKLSELFKNKEIFIQKLCPIIYCTVMLVVKNRQIIMAILAMAY